MSHTHFNTQVFWDGQLTPSPLHGVTTALGGNCWASRLHPLSDDTRGRRLPHANVGPGGGHATRDTARQPFPGASGAQRLSISTQWSGRLGINAGFMTGHSAIRRVVMGEGATARGGVRRPRWRQWDGCCAKDWRRAHSDFRRRGPAPTMAPMAAWFHPATPAKSRDPRLCRAAVGSIAGTSLGVHPHDRGRSNPGRSSSWPRCQFRRSVL